MTLNTKTSREAQRYLGRVLDDCQRSPIAITRNGHTVAVIVSAADYTTLTAKERQQASAALGTIGHALFEASQQILVNDRSEDRDQEGGEDG